MIKIKNIATTLTAIQQQQLQIWVNKFILKEAEEVKQSIIEYGIDFQDAVEWMDEITRQGIFRSCNYYSIMNYEQPEDYLKGAEII